MPSALPLVDPSPYVDRIPIGFHIGVGLWLDLQTGVGSGKVFIHMVSFCIIMLRLYVVSTWTCDLSSVVLHYSVGLYSCTAVLCIYTYNAEQVSRHHGAFEAGCGLVRPF